MQVMKQKGHWYRRINVRPAEVWERIRDEEEVKKAEKRAEMEVKPSRLGMWDQLLRDDK